jgi:hypothetical protein
VIYRLYTGLLIRERKLKAGSTPVAFIIREYSSTAENLRLLSENMRVRISLFPIRTGTMDDILHDSLTKAYDHGVATGTWLAGMALSAATGDWPTDVATSAPVPGNLFIDTLYNITQKKLHSLTKASDTGTEQLQALITVISRMTTVEYQTLLTEATKIDAQYAGCAGCGLWPGWETIPRPCTTCSRQYEDKYLYYNKSH